MHRFLPILFCLLSLTMLNACHSDDDDLNDREAVNTIMVFMPNSGFGTDYDLYDCFIDNLTDMEKAITSMGGLGKERLVVFIASSKTKANLIEIGYKNKKLVRDTLKTYSSGNANTEEQLSSILHDMHNAAPANSYSLIVGSHGEGWLPANNKAPRRTRFFGSANNDNRIDITVLAQAISNNGLHLDYILFDDCYMSTIEVAYDLRKVADYLIASTCEMMVYGMPYHKIFPYLTKSRFNLEQVNSQYHKFYTTYRMPYGQLGITKLENVQDMAQMMADINARYTFDTSLIDEIQDLDAGHHKPTIYFDFGDYVHKLLSNEAELTQFDKLLNELVPYKSTTEYLYSNSGGKSAVNAFSGITISDPSTNSKAITSKTKTAWWKATHPQ